MRENASTKTDKGLRAGIEALERRQLLSGGLLYAVTAGFEDNFTSGDAIAVDASGNSYVAGTFEETVDFAPGKATRRLTSADDSFDIFIAKYNSAGGLVWARRLGGVEDETVTSIKLAPNGDLYLTGTFEETLPYTTVQGRKRSLISKGRSDGFVARLDGKGRMRWMGAIGGSKEDFINTVEVDGDGSVFISGTVRLAGDIDPTSRNRRIVTRGVDDTFISRIDPDTANLIWTTVFGELNSAESAYHLVADGAGGVYAAGAYFDQLEFDRGNPDSFRESEGDMDIYLAHLDAAGQWDMLKTFGGDDFDYPSGLAMGPQGDLFMTGTFRDQVNFDPDGSVVLESIGESDGFVARFGTDGSLGWVRQLGGEDAIVRPQGIAVAPSGNVITTGMFEDAVDFDPGDGDFVLDSDPGEAVKRRTRQVPFPIPYLMVAAGYVSMLSQDGDFIFAGAMGGDDGSVAPRAVGLDSAGNAYITGAFVGEANFAPKGAPVIRQSVDDDKESDLFLIRVRA